MKPNHFVAAAGTLALAAALSLGLAAPSAQASALPVIPQANLLLSCDSAKPMDILFSDVKAGDCSVEWSGNALRYHTSGVVGAQGPNDWKGIHWYKSSKTAEWGTGRGWNIAHNLRVTVKVYWVKSYHGKKYFSRLTIYWLKGSVHYHWTGKRWSRLPESRNEISRLDHEWARLNKGES